MRVLAGAILFAASIAPFAVGLVIITYLLSSATGLAAAVVTACAVGLGILLPLAIHNHLALLGNRALRRNVTAKLTAPGHSPEGMAFIGFSPGESLRVWEGETDRDVGFLETAEAALVYQGDTFAWALRREDIDAVELLDMPGAPQRVAVSWHTPGQPPRTFTVGSREASTLRASNRATLALFEVLEKWYAESGELGEVPTLGPPPTSVAGSLPLEKLPAGSCLSVLAISAMSLLCVWYVAQQMTAAGFYCHAILWSGLIVVGAMLFASYFLSYLQAAEGRESSRRLTPK